MDKDTITALATAPLQSAIAVIRISGEKTFEILNNIFVSKKKPQEKNLQSLKRIVGFIKDNDKIIDEVILFPYKSPKSYTGEDMAEISCHGNPIIINNILNLLIQKGIRIAEPGEFTKRAFLNGKIDLSQAEAVADIISASNEIEVQIALNQLLGKEHKVIEDLHSHLLKILTLVESEIDFADEDIHKLTQDEIKTELKKTIKKLDFLIENSESGILLKEGLKIVITGSVNTGKSSLLNILLKKNKAIVTHIPGTTRDIIEDTIYMDGLPVKIYDTAGVRETNDIAEIEGIKRTYNAIESADIILFLIDNSKGIKNDDIKLFKKIKNKKYILIINKIDLKQAFSIKKLKNILELEDTTPIIKISCLKKKGINALTKLIKNIIIKNNIFPVDKIIIANKRHRESLIKAKNLINNAIKIAKKDAYELMAFYLKKAADEAGSIIGKITTENILENIFKNFCIGK